MITHEHSLGPRSVLTPGTKFRVTDGPYWVTNAGEHVPLKARGVMTFKAKVTEPNGITYIEARSNKEGDVILHIDGERRNRVMGPQYVCRPYRITGRVGIRRSRGVRG